MPKTPAAEPAPDGIPSTLASLAVPVDGLVPYGRNPRRGDVSLIAESLRLHGQYRPIVVRAGTNEVLAGNHTLAAAKSLGWSQIAATFVDVDDDRAARIVLVDNRAGDAAGYDDAVLAGLLTELAVTDEGLDGTGYDEAALAALLGDEAPPESADALADTEDAYQEQYGVIVICANDAEQEQVYEQLREQGFNCRVVTT